MATHSRMLAWEIPWTEEPGGLQPIGSQKVRHDLGTKPSHAWVYCASFTCSSWSWSQLGKRLRVGPLIYHLKLSNNNGNNCPLLRKTFTSRRFKILNRNDVVYHPQSFLLTKPKGICTHHFKQSVAVLKAQREGGWERHKDELHILVKNEINLSPTALKSYIRLQDNPGPAWTTYKGDLVSESIGT